VVLEVLFVYGFGWGLAGSAWGTVIAQAGMGLAFVRVQRRAGWQRTTVEPDPARSCASEVTSRCAPRRCSAPSSSPRPCWPASVPRRSARTRSRFQLFVFLALVLDALAIAGQVMVGNMLGGDDARGAREAAARMIGWSVAAGAAFGALLLASGDLIPGVFTNDPAVVAQASEIWWIFALMMPANGAVFALDGILIGAGDTRFLMWGMLAAAAVYVPVALLALDRGWGIRGVWLGLAGLIAVRLATCGIRFAGRPLGAHRCAGAFVVPCAPSCAIACSPCSPPCSCSAPPLRRSRRTEPVRRPAPGAADARAHRRAGGRSEQRRRDARHALHHRRGAARVVLRDRLVDLTRRPPVAARRAA
jgi:hypothetical protein